MTRRPASRAFTLVELLVVMAIMSILAALLMPVLREAMAAARGVACQNQSKQCYLTLTFYADDYRGLIPQAYTGGWEINGSTHCHWMHRLCGAGYSDRRWQDMVACPVTGAANICYNADVDDHNHSGAVNGHYPLFKTYRPADLYLLWDSRGGYWYSCRYYPGYPHAKGTNITFADGHVKRMQYLTLPGYSWSRMLPYYNKKGFASDPGISTEFWAP